MWYTCNITHTCTGIYSQLSILFIDVCNHEYSSSAFLLIRLEIRQYFTLYSVGSSIVMRAVMCVPVVRGCGSSCPYKGVIVIRIIIIMYAMIMNLVNL